MSQTINVYLRGGLEHEYPISDDNVPFVEQTGGCLYVSDGQVVTGYPLAAILFWQVTTADVAA